MKQSLRITAMVAVLALAGLLHLPSANASIKIDISAHSLNFGIINYGTTSDRTIIITNEGGSTGTGTIQLTAPKDQQDWQIVGGWDPFSLAPGQSRTLTIRFSPQAVGPYVDTVVISDNGDGIASANPTRVDLSGNGCNCGGTSDTTLVTSITSSLSSSHVIDFGTVSVGQVVSGGFLITDISSGNTTRSLNGTVGSTGNPFFIISGQGGYTLSSGNSHGVTINYGPTHAGSFFDSIIVTSNADDQASRRIVVYLTGQATTAHTVGDTTLVFSFNGTIPTNDYLDFGQVTVGSKAELSFTILDGSSSSTIRQLFGIIGSTNIPFLVSSGQGQFTLNSGGTITVTLTFMPGSKGIYNDSVTLVSNADNPSLRHIVLHLHGVGVQNVGGPSDSTSALAISGLTQVVNFGYVAVNDIGLRYFTISNVSSANITVTGNVTPLSDPFKVQTGVGAFTLAKGAPQNVFVSFQPKHLGAFYDSIIVTSNAANAARMVVYVLGTSTKAGVEASMIAQSGLSVYPNPFNEKNTIAFTLDRAANVSLRVYDLLSAEVANLTQATLTAGQHQFEWNATGLRNGTYFYRLQVGSETKTARVILSR